MKPFRRLISASAAMLSALLLAPLANAQTAAITTFARLGGTPDGYHPMTALLAGGDGAYYGVTEAGGPANCGTVYKITPDGTLTTLHSFGGADGANPKAALVNGGDGFFYGTTNGGGANGTGTIFKVSATGAFTSLHSFSAVNATSNNYNDEGAFPLAALVLGGDGFLYGVASVGGAAGDGTIFRVTPGGAFNVVHALANATEGTTPSFALTPGGDGNFYGVTRYGGTGSGAFFRVSPAGVYQVVSTFPNGNNPASELFLSGGVFYGLSQGVYGVSSGIFYSVTPAGALTTLHNFTATEGNVSFGGPTYSSGLSHGTDGNFYMATPTGGANNAGALLQLTPAGALTTRYALTSNDGSYPSGAPVLGADGNLYGAIAGYLTSGGSVGGSVYQLNPAGTLTTLHPFKAGGYFSAAGLMQGADGTFYGTTKGGGAKNGGTVFAYNPDGVLLGLYDPDPDAEGRGPDANLVDGGDGSFYGTTAGGGPDGFGTVFQLTATSQTGQTSARMARASAGPSPREHLPGIGDVAFGWIVRRIPFDDDDFYSTPSTPRGVTLHRPAVTTKSRAAALSSSGGPTLYGVFQAGASGGGGALFSSSADGTGSFLHQFGVDSSDGRLPSELVEGTDGSFYGVTYGGGSAGAGTVFKCGVDGTYSVLYSFQGSGDGALPQAGLTFGTDGNLYGTTSAGDVQQGGNGTIFKITPDGTFTTLHVFSSDAYAEGSRPLAALLQASDGKLYGTTSTAGPGGGYGTVFSITPDGTFATVGGFNDLRGNGALPEGPLIEAADGNLYGTTTAGGTDGAGVIYKVVLNPTTTSALPAVTLTATTPSVTAGSGGVGVFTLTLPAAQANDLHVNLEIKGTAINGQDYTLLKTSKKIKAGKTQKPIKIKPQGDLGGAKKTVKLTLAPGDGYTVGTTDKVKVKILPAAP